MIKNNRQLASGLKRIKEIENKLHELDKKGYEDVEIGILAGYLKAELKELKTQIEEYEELVRDTLDESVRGRLRKPILLDEIGELLAKLRIAAGLTQKDIADLLGWKQSNVSRFESEDYQSQTIAKVAEYADSLGVWLYVVPELEELGEEITYRKNSHVETDISSEGIRLELSSLSGFLDLSGFSKENAVLYKGLHTFFSSILGEKEHREHSSRKRPGDFIGEKSTEWSTDTDLKSSVFEKHINSNDFSNVLAQATNV